METGRQSERAPNLKSITAKLPAAAFPCFNIAFLSPPPFLPLPFRFLSFHDDDGNDDVDDANEVEKERKREKK